MRMKKKICPVIGLLITILFVAACSEKKTEQEILPKGSFYIYTVNSNVTGIDSKVYEAKNVNTDQLITELLTQMSYDPANFENKHAINENVVLKEFSVNDRILMLNFDSAYENQEPITEALMRASIVKTLNPINGVDYIEFYINGSPLTDGLDQQVGQMIAENFIDDHAVENSSLPAIFSVYYSNESGDKLIECTEKEMNKGTSTMEQLILQRLIQGPDEAEQAEGFKAVIPGNTVLNNVMTKEGVCYVDFSKEYLEVVDGITDEKISIFAVVNSLVELNNINKVQIMIDGKIIEKYRDGIDLDTIFERNLDLVEGSK